MLTMCLLKFRSSIYTTANAAITTTTTLITISTTNHALFQQKRYDIEHL